LVEQAGPDVREIAGWHAAIKQSVSAITIFPLSTPPPVWRGAQRRPDVGLIGIDAR
jgi:hypothetical protein